MEKPMIGVLPLYDKEKESYWMLPGYMKGIEAAGGIPVMLPLTTDTDILEKTARMFDGFLFTGGQDVSPTFYGEKIGEACGETCMERDRMEAVLFEIVNELDKPVFGICRALQLFNVLLGGTLYQDLPSGRKTSLIEHKQKPPYATPVHEVTIEVNTLLGKILQEKKIDVNSYHHQGIKKKAEKLQPAAYAADGLMEAAVMPDQSFNLAVQWHPEFSYEKDKQSVRLFQAFVDACRK
ncbi:gamma-glutamyl-gamma-aminobutyrate hydrolase family protein [Alkalicoccus halolimnae]|uniref:Gamma-glutamyl-gamma-aminobutyrate hydrolase family protein n=1 Tax=Alkalicoccus halolimnae TaxID=1667239 RepID=A0A5C7F7I1_9BACI|nr:gamma-glutamyl-gamma-aminobutyrate hydrolase family protein [Alkalicoccus halolimnae]TXF85358.1 gamma-glutamyl-gamma-aminobutyrate hydrolase family protein [Alkalicoccus halolimnae]